MEKWEINLDIKEKVWDMPVLLFILKLYFNKCMSKIMVCACVGRKQHLKPESQNPYLFFGNTMSPSEEFWVSKMKLYFLCKSKMKFQHARDDLQQCQLPTSL